MVVEAEGDGELTLPEDPVAVLTGEELLPAAGTVTVVW